MRCVFIIAAVVLSLAGVSHAQSSDPGSAAKVQLARKLHEEGMDAISKGQWSLAYDRLKASYDLAGRLPTLFNLATAQAQTGRLVEASESYRKFLREADATKYGDNRAEATAQLELLEKQIAHVTLEIPRLEAGDVVAIDGADFPSAVLHESLPMNPGSHTAVVRRGGAVIATKQITLTAGALDSVQIDLTGKLSVDLNVKPRSDSEPPQTTVTGTADTTSHPEPHGRSALRSPWLWSAAAVVVAGSVTAAYFLTRDNGDVLAIH